MFQKVNQSMLSFPESVYKMIIHIKPQWFQFSSVSMSFKLSQLNDMPELINYFHEKLLV